MRRSTNWNSLQPPTTRTHCGAGERGHAVPAQLHVVVEAAADHVRMAVVETGDHAATVQIDGHRIRLAQYHDFSVVADGRKHPLLDGNRCCGRMGGIERRDPAVEEYDVGR